MSTFKTCSMICFLFSSSVWAAQRDIYDLMYLPEKNTSFGRSEASYLFGSASIKNVADLTLKGVQLRQTLGHAFSDKFLLSGSLDYVSLDTKSKYNPALGEPPYSTSTRGVGDPSLQARYRLMENKITLDLIGGVSFSTGNARTSGHISNNKGHNSLNDEGGDRGRLGVQIGRKKSDIQYAALFQVGRALRNTSQTDGKEMREDGHNNYLVEFDLLNQLGEKSFLKTMASANFITSYSNNDVPPSTYPSETHYKVGAEYQHLVSKDLLARVGATYEKININSGLVMKFDFFNFNVGLNYQF